MPEQKSKNFPHHIKCRGCGKEIFILLSPTELKMYTSNGLIEAKILSFKFICKCGQEFNMISDLPRQIIDALQFRSSLGEGIEDYSSLVQTEMLPKWFFDLTEYQEKLLFQNLSKNEQNLFTLIVQHGGNSKRIIKDSIPKLNEERLVKHTKKIIAEIEKITGKKYSGI